jgi:hypothetical protein
MSPDAAMFPPTVFTLWWVGVAVTLVVFIPLAVYMLYCLWRTVRSIQIYARDALTAAAGIAGHTANLPALDSTIGVASEILSTAEAIAAKLDTIATVLAARAR